MSLSLILKQSILVTVKDELIRHDSVNDLGSSLEIKKTSVVRYIEIASIRTSLIYNIKT